MLERERHFVNVIKQQLVGSDINSLDLTTVFDDKDDVYVDHIHYNDHGNHIIAKRIFRHLRDMNAI